VLQFQMATWLTYGAPFGATPENIYEPELQEAVASRILDDGGWRNWYTCALRAQKQLGPWPI
jgi:hypothetical protein